MATAIGSRLKRWKKRDLFCIDITIGYEPKLSEVKP